MIPNLSPSRCRSLLASWRGLELGFVEDGEGVFQRFCQETCHLGPVLETPQVPRRLGAIVADVSRREHGDTLAKAKAD